MARTAITVGLLATKAHIDTDEALIVLWDSGIDYVKGPASIVRRRDANRARRLVGLPTERELASRRFWQSQFGLDDDGFSHLLETLAIPVSETGKLPTKAINRLQAEADTRELTQIGVVDPKRADDARDGSSTKQPVVGPPPFVWKTIGQERDIYFLRGDDVRAIHYELVQEFAADSNPIEPPGVRDGVLLDSAITRPYTTFGEDRKYPSVEMAAAALLHSLIHNHPFHNGNKRTALVSMLAFLDLNRLMVTCEEEELFRIVLKIAQHGIVSRSYDYLPDREALFIADWVHKHSRRIELGDRNIPFRRLRKLLTRYDCTYGPPRGNQISIHRAVTERDWLRRDRQVPLSSRAPYSNEGRDIDSVSIAKVRKDLRLDEPHGIDSASFYRNAPAAAGDFIIKYRKTLHRLARL